MMPKKVPLSHRSIKSTKAKRNLITKPLNSLNQTSLNGRKDPELIVSLALENTMQRNPNAAFSCNYALRYGGIGS